MASPPPTPPAVMSPTEEPRFVETEDPCEDAEMYRPGGFHPVHLGDTFKNGQYRVIRKLGDGSFSTVWLAVDNQFASTCPLNKITFADIKILKRLSLRGFENCSCKIIGLGNHRAFHLHPTGGERKE
jgi:hypothetical protein